MIEIRQEKHRVNGVRVGYRFERMDRYTLTCDRNGAPQLTAALRTMGASEESRHPADWPSATAHVSLWSYSPDFELVEVL
jgi:hypothetical protein